MAEFSGGSNYDQIRINGTTVDSANNFVTGQKVDITDTTIAASPAARPSMRVFVDSPDTQLPDITISGQATSATIELNNFNNDVEGQGITFKITLFNGNTVIGVLVFTT
jgi:hypothetical protein